MTVTTSLNQHHHVVDPLPEPPVGTTWHLGISCGYIDLSLRGPSGNRVLRAFGVTRQLDHAFVVPAFDLTEHARDEMTTAAVEILARRVSKETSAYLR